MSCVPLYGLSWVVIIRFELSVYQSFAATCVTRGHLSHIPQYTIQNRTCTCLNCEIWGRCTVGFVRLLYQYPELLQYHTRWSTPYLILMSHMAYHVTNYLSLKVIIQFVLFQGSQHHLNIPSNLYYKAHKILNLNVSRLVLQLSFAQSIEARG